MSRPCPRLAVRALILHQDRLLLVNAWPGDDCDLWCAPGGGILAGTSLPDNLIREVFEETGLGIAVGAPALINEFHDKASGFHQIEVFFRCAITSGALRDDWRDPEGIVSRRHFFARDDLAAFRVKPDSLAQVAWGSELHYDPLEEMLQ